MPDERVTSAIANWAPRFTSQGVDYNDFVRTTRRIEGWNDWCREWCATGDMHTALAHPAYEKGNRISAGEAFVAAALCYHFAKFMFQDHPGEYKAAGRKSIEAFAQGLRLLDPSGVRIEIPFEGAILYGTLRRPQGADRPPLVLLLPGLDSTKEEFFYWEEVFLKRGLATFSLEGPGQGECGALMHIRPDYETAVSAALDFLGKRKDIDMKRVGMAGVSLGGFYSERAAAFEDRVKAAVGNCGPWSWAECWPHLPQLSKDAYIYHSGSRDEAEAVKKAGELSLDGVAQKIKQPLLIIHGKMDRIVPWEQAKKIAAAVGANAQLALFEDGNHVCNNIPSVYRPLTADWLNEKLS
ncbi:MAG TPA: prolyl oligopeptidase family serine peptidase [Anaerolineales bacterium]|nr:prolyl oligopeptidase family serine peptidase [Anaerolineales bacterium]